MSHFAKIDANNIVIEVIVAEQPFIDSLPDKEKWIKTSYNTHGGKHLLGGDPLRKNYAGIGFLYDETKDAFIPPKIFESWVLNEETCLWEAPVPYPTDMKNYIWDEEFLKWVIQEEEYNEDGTTLIDIKRYQLNSKLLKKSYITRVGNCPPTKESEQAEATLVMESLPEAPQVEAGKMAVMHIDPATKQFSYLIKDKPENVLRFEKLQQLVLDGKITQEEMNELL